MVSFQHKREKIRELNQQLYVAGVTGFLKGALVGVVSGYYFMYRYNHGVNLHFFRTPIKFGYVMSWGVAGLVFDTDKEKYNISRQLAIEEELKRNLYMNGGR